MSALPREFASRFLGDGRLDDDRVGRGTEDAVVEALAEQDVARGLRDVGRSLDEAGSIAWADTVGRLTRAVGGADESQSACGQDDGDVAVPHQFLRALERNRLH